MIRRITYEDPSRLGDDLGVGEEREGGDDFRWMSEMTEASEGGWRL